MNSVPFVGSLDSEALDFSDAPYSLLQFSFSGQSQTSHGGQSTPRTSTRLCPLSSRLASPSSRLSRGSVSTLTRCVPASQTRLSHQQPFSGHSSPLRCGLPGSPPLTSGGASSAELPLPLVPPPGLLFAVPVAPGHAGAIKKSEVLRSHTPQRPPTMSVSRTEGRILGEHLHLLEGLRPPCPPSFAASVSVNVAGFALPTPLHVATLEGERGGVAGGERSCAPSCVSSPVQDNLLELMLGISTCTDDVMRKEAMTTLSPTASLASTRASAEGKSYLARARSFTGWTNVTTFGHAATGSGSSDGAVLAVVAAVRADCGTVHLSVHTAADGGSHISGLLPRMNGVHLPRDNLPEVVLPRPLFHLKGTTSHEASRSLASNSCPLATFQSASASAHLFPPHATGPAVATQSIAPSLTGISQLRSLPDTLNSESLSSYLLEGPAATTGSFLSVDPCLSSLPFAGSLSQTCGARHMTPPCEMPAEAASCLLTRAPVTGQGARRQSCPPMCHHPQVPSVHAVCPRKVEPLPYWVAPRTSLLSPAPGWNTPVAGVPPSSFSRLTSAARQSTVPSSLTPLSSHPISLSMTVKLDDTVLSAASVEKICMCALALSSTSSHATLYNTVSAPLTALPRHSDDITGTAEPSAL